VKGQAPSKLVFGTGATAGERKKNKMAKVINPLLSGSASGQLGHMMTFDKRGYVRQYVIPANPQSVAQMAVREALADIQAELKTLGTVLRLELKASFGARWNSLIIGELMANSKAVYDAYVVEWTAFQSGEKTAWQGADLVQTPLALNKGELLYAVASAINDIAVRLDEELTLTVPGHDTATTTAAEWVA
jgi:hypothetical protein